MMRIKLNCYSFLKKNKDKILYFLIDKIILSIIISIPLIFSKSKCNTDSN